MTARGWLLLLTLLVSTASHAQLQFALEGSGLTPEQRHASQTLLDEAHAALPPHLREALDRDVAVHWVDMPADNYGRAGRLSGVELNAKLLPSLTDGSAASTPNGRPHGTVRQELLATVLHEITHLYDRGTYWSAEQRTLLRRCQRQNADLGPVGLRPECRGQTERRFTLSDDPRLLDLAGWPQRVGKRGERDIHNGQVARSPDNYELSNPREFVAVNIEYFLLDPEYACRRPSLARFFSEHFGWAPARQTPCGNGYAYLNAGRDFDKQALANLDPERVYEVDYLLAEANQNMASRWGHSMLRLVICAPGRPRGPDCRLDLDQHLVLSYRAFVNDVQLSSWDGLTGAYPSRLFVLPLAQVIEEYTKVELRSLASVPLKLSRERLEQLVARAVEQHWSYDGDYFFVSNNCAVETLKLLRSGTADPRLQTLDSITPIGLLEVLEARDLADGSVLNDSREALRLGYRFDSFRDRYQAMFKVLQQRLPIRQQRVEDWLEQPSEQRRQWFEQADLRASAAMLLLEQAAMRRQLLLSQDELKQRYLTGRAAKDPSLNKAGDALEQILANTGFLSRPAELLEGGYGLPQQEEWQRLESETRTRQQQLSLLSADLDGEVRSLLEPQRLAELEANEANLKQLGDHLRKLHKESGGLQL
ncbi:hypothetical protein Pstr01_17740 [Pseudomonas straminea]|uniref:Uncharacterized protein n=2 Tax=Pseudomonas straminea TaxID=47882 RepID=A0A1I1VDN7_PSEOC|nr:DUF4105 domain-containing protein [Pseudomonas straminea]GLX13535.1 hypothetical protein Pstr01_17740 [Pseudomonas straminea]SFD81162.1 protein of unknown function [Pseudomonas straminea]